MWKPAKVRYGSRSDLIDWWKAIPLNFFVPWRTGSVVSVVKNLAQRPLRTALYMGAVEYLREEVYRHTGKYFHIPADYLTGPVTEAIKTPGKIGALLADNTLLGPGGSIIRLFQTASGLYKSLDGTSQQVWKNLYWGIAQVFGKGGLGDEMYKFSQDGDTDHLTNAMMNATLGAYGDLKNPAKPHSRPLELLKAIPDVADRMSQGETRRMGTMLAGIKQGHIDQLQDADVPFEQKVQASRSAMSTEEFRKRVLSS